MDERTALTQLAKLLPAAGDDAAVVEDLVLTTDMLHDRSDFPKGTSRYTAGWRAVGASLSDVAAMGAPVTAAVAVYAAPSFEESEITAFIEGARDVCEAVDGAYVGGDLDHHNEFTVVTSAVGRTETPVYRSGAQEGNRVCVTGTLGRTAVALRYFDRGAFEVANELFCFHPRVQAGTTLADRATAMMDSSDGLARSLHQLAEASGCGFSIDSSAIPIDDRLLAEFDSQRDEALDPAISTGEDFELVCTLPESAVEPMQATLDVTLTDIGEVVAEEITLDGSPLPDRGYTHAG